LADAHYVIIDLRRVTGIDDAAAEMLARFGAEAQSLGSSVLLTHVERHPALAAAMKKSIELFALPAPQISPDVDAAIEQCENDILNEFSRPGFFPQGLDEFELMNAMTPEQVGVLRAALIPGEARDGEVIIRAGDDADRIFFLTEGSVSVTIDGPDGKPIRVATTSPMTSFGEMALLDRHRRSANVIADGQVRFFSLPFDKFERLQRDRPDVAIKLLSNMARGLSEKLRRANETIGALSG
jgi:hypothetical protein